VRKGEWSDPSRRLCVERHGIRRRPGSRLQHVITSERTAQAKRKCTQNAIEVCDDYFKLRLSLPCCGRLRRLMGASLFDSGNPLILTYVYNWPS
jgi:hypothetical protein